MTPEVAARIEALVKEAPPLSDRQKAALVNLFGMAEPGTRPLVNARPQPRPERTALYRHFDREGVLLYVGISSSPQTRRKSHARYSPWVEFARSERVEWFDDRDAAEAAERAAIREERPLFNGTFSTAASKAAAVAYLVDKERLDLLYVGPRRSQVAIPNASELDLP